MSVGNIREDFDKQNDPCKVLDCIINPEIWDQLEKKTDLALINFFSELLVSYIFQKHKIELSIKDFRIPKLKYKGKFVEFQRVRGKKSPKIQVVNMQENENWEKSQANKEFNKNVTKETVFGEQSSIRKPDWSLKVIDFNDEEIEFDGFNINYDESKGLVYLIDLPLMVTGKYMVLQASKAVIVLNCGKVYHIKLKVPLEILPERTDALFLSKNRQLKVTVMLKLADNNQEAKDNEEHSGTDDEAEQGKNILKQNVQKIMEHKIEIKSDLLSDLV